MFHGRFCGFVQKFLRVSGGTRGAGMPSKVPVASLRNASRAATARGAELTFVFSDRTGRSGLKLTLTIAVTKVGFVEQASRSVVEKFISACGMQVF